MIVIDIAQRAALRAYDFHPGYGRRTDADRRPARRVVMPNDGPAPDREARAAAILQRIETPKPWMREPNEEKRETFNDGNAAMLEMSRRRMVRYLQALIEGAHTNAEVAAKIGEDQDIIHYIGARAAKRGLLVKGELALVGKMRVVPLTITDAGRAWLEANL